MRELYRSNAIIFGILLFTVSEVCAMGVSVTAGNGGLGTAGLSTEYNAEDKTTVEDLSILSFNGGLGIQKQISLQGGSGDLHEVHETTSSDGAVAGVTVDIVGAEGYTYGYILDPDQTASAKASTVKTATASESLDVTDADDIIASAYGVSVKGDNAYQSLMINSPSGQACLSGYSNRATANANSATATQSFDLVKSDGQIAISSNAWVDDLSGKQDSIPKYYADANIYGFESKKLRSSIGSFTSSSSAKSEKTASVTESAASLSGLYFRLVGSAANYEDDIASFNDEIVGLESEDGSLILASISDYSSITSTNANSASETRRFGSISADAFKIDEFAVNANNDYIGHSLAACSLNENDIYKPAVVKGYCPNKGDGLKAQKASATGSISIKEASFGGIDLSATASHINDYSFGSIAGSDVALSKTGGQAYKATLSATPKATSLNLGASIKGFDYSVYTEAYSSSRDSFVYQTASPKKAGLITYTVSASAKSNGKASASIKSKAA